MTTRFAHGLVIGKFYPPHLGHDHLISTAARQCGRVTVLVMAASDESIPGGDRARWLTSAHAQEQNVHVLSVPSDAPVDYTDDIVWTAQVALMRAAASQVSDVPVDVVFSSELYGEELAARLDAQHVLVDPERSQVPVSSTMLRANLASNWHLLTPAARAGLALRVVLVGAESTGTTTIAELLTARYRAQGGIWSRTRCVAEYGREYTEVKWAHAIAEARKVGRNEPSLDELIWTSDEFDDIAVEQTRREEAAAVDGSPLLICDTDAFATSIWERRYLGEAVRHEQAWATHGLPRRDVYLLTSHDGVPWLDDGLREGDLEVRASMTDWFANALTRAGHSWVLLTGDVDQRVQIAATVIDRLMRARLSFAASITENSTAPTRS
ncbi:MAG TPA: AAA family ATPase [Mycobacteriales bacterium]|nr:AAA family ATPase [Mycobacteriales bacterium]